MTARVGVLEFAETVPLTIDRKQDHPDVVDRGSVAEPTSLFEHLQRKSLAFSEVPVHDCNLRAPLRDRSEQRRRPRLGRDASELIEISIESPAVAVGQRVDVERVRADQHQVEIAGLLRVTAHLLQQLEMFVAVAYMVGGMIQCHRERPGIARPTRGLDACLPELTRSIDVEQVEQAGAAGEQERKQRVVGVAEPVDGLFQQREQLGLSRAGPSEPSTLVRNPTEQCRRPQPASEVGRFRQRGVCRFSRAGTVLGLAEQEQQLRALLLVGLVVEVKGLEREVVGPGSFLVRRGRTGAAAGACRVVDRLVDVAAGSGLKRVVGKFGEMRVESRGVQGFERGEDLAV